MFKIESYVTPILLSYVDKYVKDFKPADAQVSLWAGGVALHNLVLKADVLQKEVALPFTLVSGRIHELLIQVPWTKIMSESIVVTIDTIECVLSLNQPATAASEEGSQDLPSRKAPVVEAPPGYMQALVRRIVSNIAVRVHHLIVKYVQDDIVMSLNVKHLAVDAAGPDWEPSFADIDQTEPVIRRLMRLDNLTLCLDRADADGKIRFYQEPLLYRCQLDFRILTRLVSATRRQASSLNIQLRSSDLAWGVTKDQLTLLLRLVRERPGMERKSPTPVLKTTVAQTAPSHITTNNSAEPLGGRSAARSESWSEWAWSWLPTWEERDGEVDEESAPPAPVPIHFAAYFDNVSFIFKVTETDTTRKRARGVLELRATQTAFKSSICNPTTIRMRVGTRSLTLLSRGKCVCGHLDYNGIIENPTIYLRKKETAETSDEWEWPEFQLSEVVAIAQAGDEHYRPTPDLQDTSDHGLPEEPAQEPSGVPKDEADEFWQKMAPLFSVEYVHERSPPRAKTNPYDKPPIDFQYSDWVEECEMKVQFEPVEVRVCMGLVHRLSTLGRIFQDLPPVPDPDLPKHILTVEECEALSENLPQRRITIEASGLHVQVHPNDHIVSERPTLPPLVLDLDLPKNSLIINGPLYPHRVCSAACQMPDDSGPLWQGARLHITLSINNVQAKICSTIENQARPCARAEIKAVVHVLLNKEYFTRRESVNIGYSVKIREANVCGSAPRLQAAWHVINSLLMRRASFVLVESTLAADALRDEELVAIDMTCEGLSARGYFTKNTYTNIVTLQSMKATALHETQGCDPKQAWLFSAPDTPTNAPYLRLAVQWCRETVADSIDYVGLWTEPTAIAVDPLLIAWLAYQPTLKPMDFSSSATTIKSMSSQYYMRRRPTPPSSSGRGGTRSGSGAEVHGRARSAGSSDKGENRNATKVNPPDVSPLQKLCSNSRLLSLHERLRRMVLNVELGLAMVYVTLTTASALDCATVRDAMERHASTSQAVVALSLGHLTMFSSSVSKQFWEDVNHDGPTFLELKPGQNRKQPQDLPDSFPWKFRIVDVQCYTLNVTEARGFPESGLRSQLKTANVASPRIVLEVVTMTVTVSMVTKSLKIVKRAPKPEVKKEKESTFDINEAKLKYFTKGINFKPTTLKEFVRGPAKRKKADSPEPDRGINLESPTDSVPKGPIVSLGIHVHGDTPPLVIRLEQDQVYVIAATVHCFTHILTLLQRPPLLRSRTTGSFNSFESQRSVLRSVSEFDDHDVQTSSEETTSESKSELIPIFEAHPVIDVPALKIKTFFWFQWVMSRVTVVAATDKVKLAFDVDDIISTVDVQSQYRQLKVMVASASMRHYTRAANNEWKAGVLGGRVIEVREPSNAQEETHLMTVTVTQARISSLPTSWREELHPKLLEDKNKSDFMWEVYATLAPLEVVIQPDILEQVVSLVVDMAPGSFCPLPKELKTETPSNWQRPFVYVTAGGLRLLLNVEDGTDKADDTFMFVVGKVTVNPHPENPICRRNLNKSTPYDNQNFDGRQYEVAITNVAIRCAQFKQLVSQESIEAEMMKGTARENPALKWTQQIVSPNITPILHNLDIGCVVAPALYLNGVLTFGPAVEVNLISDCVLELSLDQLVMAQKVTHNLYNAIEKSKGETPIFGEGRQGVCPFATLLTRSDDVSVSAASIAILADDNLKSTSDVWCSVGADSGVDTASTSTAKQQTSLAEDSAPSTAVKKSATVVFIENASEPTEFVEVFVTVGVIELSLYVVDDGSEEIVALRPPATWVRPPLASTLQPLQSAKHEKTESRVASDRSPNLTQSAKSLTERIRDTDIGKTKLEPNIGPQARKREGKIPLIYMSFLQPNLYYWCNKTQKSLQVSLFNAWMGLGAGQLQELWHAVVMSTAKGTVDPVTDIPPALATMKVVLPSAAPVVGAQTVRGSIRLDVERPVLLNLSDDRIQRLMGILTLVQSRMFPPVYADRFKKTSTSEDLPPLYKLRNLLEQQWVENVTVQTTQICACGVRVSVGCDSVAMQVITGGRGERLEARALLTAFCVSTGEPGAPRHLLLQPLMLGFEMDASWEAWRRAEGGAAAREPMVHACVELDSFTLDLRPSDLAAAATLADTIQLLGLSQRQPEPASRTESYNIPQYNVSKPPGVAFDQRLPVNSIDDGEQFYRDDLRSGAFKIVGSGMLPMAYQVTLHNFAVSWRYPHPRSITRLVAYPLPGEDEETECVLELYNPLLSRWEPHTYFSIPVGEPREMQLYVPSPDAVFAVMWRFRVFEGDEQVPPFEFNVNKFMARSGPMEYEPASADQPLRRPKCGVTAEQLSGVVRVDSSFSPRLSPPVRLVARVAKLDIHLHNDMPYTPSKTTTVEGYYVSKSLLRAHRVLTMRARDATLNAQLGSPAGALLLLDTNLSSDIIESATGTMEHLVQEFRLQAGVSLPNGANSRTRASLSAVHVAFNLPRLRTLQALGEDWQTAVHQYILRTKTKVNEESTPASRNIDEAEVIKEKLSGRVSLWLHNSTTLALRVGQDTTEEVVQFAPGATLAYRWLSPSASKKLCFGLSGATSPYHCRWSNCIPFSLGQYRMRIYDAEELGSSKTAPAGDVFLYTKVEEVGARLCLRVSGRLCLVNMLRFCLRYKVRVRCTDSSRWRTVNSGDLEAESVGRSVVCGADCELSLKIKFTTGDTGWSGDIPLKECPKENVPWLVKVPSEGETPYISVWCRVVRARSDGRVLASVWPLYVLYSHLALDTDVLIMTEPTSSTTDIEPPPAVIQAAAGRGACTHLLPPGTTSARHTLSFQYRNIECPVTKEAVPLHYGVTNTSVFDKRSPATSLDDVLADTLRWLDRMSRNAESAWPYSAVTPHWPGKWKSALVQPRCDVTVQYSAVYAGGGCSLQVALCPAVLLCNAAPIALTLRAHDAAPLCKLDPGTAISTPSVVLEKPFFISVEIGRDTFVSGEMTLSTEEIGRYGQPPPGCVALDRGGTELAVQCNHTVALLSMYYEIKEDINVLGLSSIYMVINRLNTGILVSPMAVPNESPANFTVLRPNNFMLIDPSAEESIHGTSLCNFWVVSNLLRGCVPADLRLYLCVALPAGDLEPRAVPVRLGQPPTRRAFALTDTLNNSVPVVVTQVKYEGRWVVSVAHDPCPQLAVYNRTSAPLAVAQPVHSDEPELSNKLVMFPECAGVRWNCVVKSCALLHYSTPEHCMRYPSAQTTPALPVVAFLSFALAFEDSGDLSWCAPVAIADGEQLLQLYGITIKIRVRSHLHSTLVELRDVDQFDMSASDIRNRLYGAFIKEDLATDISYEKDTASAGTSALLERINANSKLLVQLDDPIGLNTERELSQTTSPVNYKQAKTVHIQEASTSQQTSRVVSSNATNVGSKNASTHVIYTSCRDSTDDDVASKGVLNTDDSMDSIEEAPDRMLQNVSDNDWDETASWSACDRLRLLAAGIAIELAALPEVCPLIALHLDRAAVLVRTDARRTKTTLSIADIQVDNPQYATGQFDFAVVATTRNAPLPAAPCPPLWNLFGERRAFATRMRHARALLRLTYDGWTVAHYNYAQLSEVEVRLGPLALYVEDAYVVSLGALYRRAAEPRAPLSSLLAEERSLRAPLRLRILTLHPLDLTLTLHTAVRMYIALDQSPLRLTAFKMENAMTSPEQLTHALTVHYLSAAILGAGWVVGGLELLGAPGAVVARVGGASGGVRGVAAAAAAALLRSLSAWAGSLARNLDLLAGDEEHARRAAAARRRPPPNLLAGLAAGITNFAINILGAVGGLAHHPVVGVAVGESESGATALRRGLIGALTKPLSATADLVAYAGHGLLSQTGWDPVPQPRGVWSAEESTRGGGWRRDCVLWAFRMTEMPVLAGFQVLFDNAPLHLLFTYKFLVLADPDSGRIVEMIDFKYCSIGPYRGQIIELVVERRQENEYFRPVYDDDDEIQISAAAMARVARYTGAEAGAAGRSSRRVLSLLPAPGDALALHAALVFAAHNNSDVHFPMQ